MIEYHQLTDGVWREWMSLDDKVQITVVCSDVKNCPTCQARFQYREELDRWLSHPKFFCRDCPNVRMEFRMADSMDVPRLRCPVCGRTEVIDDTFPNRPEMRRKRDE